MRTFRAGVELARRQRTYAVGGVRLVVGSAIGRLPIAWLRRLLARQLLQMTIGADVQLYRWREVRAGERIQIGEGSVIGSWATLDGRNGIFIGTNVNLSSEVALWTAQHDPQSASFATRGGPITVEDDAWLSFRATILPGVRVGRGAVVAAGAVVTKDVPPYTIVGGIPARVIGSRTTGLHYRLRDWGPLWFA